VRESGEREREHREAEGFHGKTCLWCYVLRAHQISRWRPIGGRGLSTRHSADKDALLRREASCCPTWQVCRPTAK
jgi:hypothetical protein